MQLVSNRLNQRMRPAFAALALSSLALGASLTAATPAHAQTGWDIKLYPYYNDQVVIPYDINNSGAIEGEISSGDFISFGYPTTGFLNNGSGTVPISYPGAETTEQRRMNNGGDIAGRFKNAGGHYQATVRHADGSYTLFSGLGEDNRGLGINDAGNVVTGWYTNGSDPTQHGQIWTNGVAAPFARPGGNNNDVAFNSNNAGTIVGVLDYNSQNPQGFVLNGTTFTTIDIPGSPFTLAQDINNKGQVIGIYADADEYGKAFLYENGVARKLDFPNLLSLFPKFVDYAGVHYTRSDTRYDMTPRGLNDKGDFVGEADAEYLDPDGNTIYATQGFVATAVPEPGAVAFGIVSGAGILGLIARRRRA